MSAACCWARPHHSAGTIVSITAALDGHASLAFSNSIGGIAVQTAFLAVADVTYRKANLEHAAAELANIFQALVLIGLLALPLSAMVLPEVTDLRRASRLVPDSAGLCRLPGRQPDRARDADVAPGFHERDT